MKKIFKWVGLTLLALVAIGAIYGTFGLKKTLALDIHDVDLGCISDGTYSGSYQSYRWTNTVSVTVQGHRITAIEPVTPLAGRETLVAELTDEIIGSQHNGVDAVSGATASRNAFLKAVENALTEAGGS
jgi:uncharacterized protein with FMN-binding domain